VPSFRDILDAYKGFTEAGELAISSTAESLPQAIRQPLEAVGRGVEELSMSGADVFMGMPPQVGIFAGRRALGFAKAPNKFSSMADKMQRFEIDDSLAKTTGKAKSIKGEPWRVAETKRVLGKLDEVIDHPELYKQYPELKNYKVVINRYGSKGNASIDDVNKVIYVDGVKPRTGITNTVFHEVQHAVQDIEGFVKGGSPEVGLGLGQIRNPQSEAATKAIHILKWRGKNDKALQASLKELTPDIRELAEEWAKTKNINELKKLKGSIDFEAYQRLAGEIEARDVEARMALSPQQRQAIQPLSSEAAIPLEQFIVR
jgi:hypothetical protein